MGIVQNIPRKQGRIFTHPEATAPNYSVFGYRGDNNATIGTVGKTYASPLTSSPKAPLANFHNTATIDMTVPLALSGGQVVPVNEVKEVQPHEKGTFFHHKPEKVDKVQRGQAGKPSKKSDTPFHPQPRVVRHGFVKRPSIDSSRVSAGTHASFLASTQGLRANPHNDHQFSRWPDLHGNNGATKISASDM